MFNPLFPNDNLAGKIISKCPVCGNNKDALEMAIIEEQGESNLVYIQCKKCMSNFVGVVNFNPMGVNVVSFATDLNKAEVIKFKKGEKVSADDVLELHEALEDKKIDFIKHLAKIPSSFS